MLAMTPAARLDRGLPLVTASARPSTPSTRIPPSTAWASSKMSSDPGPRLPRWHTPRPEAWGRPAPAETWDLRPRGIGRQTHARPACSRRSLRARTCCAAPDGSAAPARRRLALRSPATRGRRLGMDARSWSAIPFASPAPPGPTKPLSLVGASSLQARDSGKTGRTGQPGCPTDG